MVVSFASRRLIFVPAALALMLGADVGTTLAAQVLSFDLGWVSPALTFTGVVAFMSSKDGQRRHLGRVAIGLGLMLLAIRLIIAASEPLRQSQALDAVLAPLVNEPLLAVLVAALIAWLAHSGLAVVLLVLSLAAAGTVPQPLAFALVLGANVGGAIAPVAATLAAPANARRVPLGNLAMRFVGVVLMLPLLDHVAPFLAALETDTARQVVNFHTGFNLALAVLFLPILDPVASALRRILPEEERREDAGQPRYLDDGAVDTPSEALASAARETLRMGDVVEEMLRRSIEAFRSNDARLAREIEGLDDVVDRLHEAIKLYLTRIGQGEMDEGEGRRYVEVLTFTINLEHIGDIIDKNLMELASKKRRNMLAFSDAGYGEIAEFNDRVMENMRLAFNVFISEDVKLARQLLGEKVAIRDAEQQATESHLARVRAGQPESIETTSPHLDVIRDLKRINAHLTSVAYPILEAAGELRESRLRTTTHASAMAAGSVESSILPNEGGVTRN